LTRALPLLLATITSRPLFSPARTAGLPFALSLRLRLPPTRAPRTPFFPLYYPPPPLFFLDRTRLTPPPLFRWPRNNGNALFVAVPRCFFVLQATSCHWFLQETYTSTFSPPLLYGQPGRSGRMGRSGLFSQRKVGLTADNFPRGFGWYPTRVSLYPLNLFPRVPGQRHGLPLFFFPPQPGHYTSPPPLLFRPRPITVDLSDVVAFFSPRQRQVR